MTEKRLTRTARKLRANATDAERILWSRIRSRQLGAKFVRQFPIGQHVADFACRSAHHIIEVDGGQHNDASDRARTASLASYGYRVIRFWNNEVTENPDGVVDVILRELSLAD